MRRSPLRRTGTLLRRTPLRRMSAKRRREQTLRRKSVEDAFGLNPACAAQLDGCDGFASDAHELKSRARGGSITVPDNILPLCRNCHAFVTGNPVWAERNGFSRHSWEEPA